MNAAAARSPALLHEFFTRSQALWPERLALDIPPGIQRPFRTQLTYAELACSAAAIAASLRAFIHAESVVAILLPRSSPFLIAAQFAVLECGAAYMCLDTAFPDARIDELLRDSAAILLLTDGESAHRITATTTVINVAGLAGAPGAPAEPSSWLTPESLAYTIYTSGTTGQPKAVMIEHRAIVNLIASDLEYFRLAPGARIAQSSSSAYDSSVEETWLALSAGATLVVMDDDTARLGPDLISWLRDERITVFCPPPTLLRAMGCEDPQAELPDLRLLYVGGEALPQDLADRWATPRIQLINGYGPTECAVTALRGAMQPGVSVHIGQPVAGLTAQVLDSQLRPVRDGDWGELCIGGVGLARGYANRPELTAEKFPVHPEFGRIYRTGDLAHRDASGNFHSHGRADSQVKIRGYRVELEEIETRLAALPGVRAAACRLQDEGAGQTLVAFIIPYDPAWPPSFDAIKTSLGETLPAYMIPSRFGILSELPLTTGGKLNRAALPMIESPRAAALDLPRDEIETRLADAIRAVLELKTPISIHDDFFAELGGDSLRAAQLVSLLRKAHPGTRIAVRDIYEARTVANLRDRLRPFLAIPMPAAHSHTRQGRHILATAVQAVWLILLFSIASSAAWLIFFEALPAIVGRISLLATLLLTLPALLIYSAFSVFATVIAKRLLIGRYRPLRAPVWGSFYVRHWMLMQVARTIPWQLLEATVFQHMVLRALGARIGRRVHIHRGVNLQRGGWDLLEVGDDVTLSQDSTLALTELDSGEIVVGPIVIGEGSTLDVRAGLSPHTILEPGAYLSALSHLPSGQAILAGEKWTGIPARPAGHAPEAPPLTADAHALSPLAHGFLVLLANVFIDLLPLLVPALVTAIAYQYTTPFAALFLAALTVPLSLALEALALRLIARMDPPQDAVISRWSLAWLRVWIKTGILQSAGDWLTGTLFWATWLRAAGMSLGPGCEFSTITDVVPELVAVGGDSFFADGIYLAGPRIHQGTVTLAPTTLGRGTFLGNHAIIPAGQHLPERLLLGVCTIADDSLMHRPGSSWFGLPPFELPKREVIAADASLTHRPSRLRYANRVFWELQRFTLDIPPLLVAIVWYRLLDIAQASTPRLVFILGVVPAITFAAAATLCVLVLALKWLLLGRARPGQHPLWSCWCSRWDYLYTAWAFFTRGTLVSLEGTLLLNFYLRAMGCGIGQRVILGAGFSQVVDPDMLIVDDDATVNCILQAHTFEDRVLKLDRIHIGPGSTLGDNTVPLYGADIGAGAHVAAHSVVMKDEHLLPGYRYEGAPCGIAIDASLRLHSGYERRVPPDTAN